MLMPKVQVGLGKPLISFMVSGPMDMAAKNYNKDEVREAVLFCGAAVYTCGSLWLLEIYSPLSSFKLEKTCG